MKEFYAFPMCRVLLVKPERTKIWNEFISKRSLNDFRYLSEYCPALFAEMEKAIDHEQNVQSAVFSECVYAQGLADHFSLDDFASYAEDASWLDAGTLNLLQTYGLVPRYIYRNKSKNRILIQAGGHGGVDGALISVLDTNVFTLEFKEPAAKTSEVDLPKYGEDGDFKITPSFIGRYPQFSSMVAEQKNESLKFFDHIGSNINNFSPLSIQRAVAENYQGKKFADVICTEDRNGFLTLLPSNQVHLWARVRGEIRPAGRNYSKVWTPEKLKEILLSIGGSINEGVVTVPLAQLKSSKQRGGTKISRYKINSLFFVKASDVLTTHNSARFAMEDVQQLRPTISAHMFFDDLEVNKVRDHYIDGV